MPPAALDSRPRIAAALAAFGTSPLPTAALGFFHALGYGSTRHFTYASTAEFFSSLDTAGKVSPLFPASPVRGRGKPAS